MANTLTITLLGTGSSGGVPRVGNDWGRCDPAEPKNRRRRCAVLIEQKTVTGTTTILIDAGADLREQLLSAQVTHLDGVVLTHPHADHIFGLDDLRQLAITLKKPIDVYLDSNTSDTVMQSFGYCFRQAPGSSYPPFCIETRIVHPNPITIEGAGGSVTLQPILVEHGDIHALGFRIDRVAYLPDMKRLASAQTASVVNGLDCLVVDALRYTTHPTHFNVDEALDFIKATGPTQAILTNMHCDLDYQTLQTDLPDGVVPGFDGLQITQTNQTTVVSA